MPRTAPRRATGEPDGARAARAARVLATLRRAYPDANCALEHRTPFQLLVATILSAQCTDARVNMVTPALFARYPDAAALAKAPRPALEKLIHSTGFFRNKAKNLKGAAQRIVAQHGGHVPDTMEALLALPGVARKTANVVLGNAFGKNEGVVVDTHVGRLARRLGFTAHEDPVKVERDLQALVPQHAWTWVAHALILHGRAICDARKPRCGECPLAADCPSKT
jgi:endonuclease-3